MDEIRITDFARSLAGVPSRRDILRGLASAGLGLGSASLPAVAEARKKGKPKKPKPNAFGCLIATL